MSNIKEGDRVRHKNLLINGGLDMPVIEVKDDEAKCSHLDPDTKEFVDTWFDLEDLILMSEGDGGFREPTDKPST